MRAEATAARGAVTGLLRAWSAGRPEAADELFPLIYRELRAVAANVLRRERGARTLDTGDLVHESFLKLLDPEGIDWRDRRHFYNVAARAMRQILVDRARRRQAGKRGSGWELTTLGAAAELAGPDLVLGLDRLLDDLRRCDARQAEIAELRIFAGLPLSEVAETVGVSLATVKRDWRMAHAWLARELGGPGAGPR
ncbi:MAG TPA: ECF-type sigma factor [Thermoanaerobaculia bacterium]|nr:ECF-type sigma factor [Thermoanaerobaculia bacterium]